MPPTDDLSIRARVPWLSLLGVILLVGFTFANAAANMLPHAVSTPRERQRQDQQQVARMRRLRIAELRARGDTCDPTVARELARALVLDGISARSYADDHERRCGDDPIVRRWGEASRLLGDLRKERIVRI